MHTTAVRDISAVVTPLQKWMLHPLTALLLALSVYHVTALYHLFDFAGAAWVAALTIFTGFLLLSRRYDTLLSVLFFSLALVVAIKTLPIKPTLDAPLTRDEKTRRQLSVLAAVIWRYQIQHPGAPVPGAELIASSGIPQTLLTVQACFGSSCDARLLPLLPATPGGFVLVAKTTNQDDKLKSVWYLNDSYTFSVGEPSL